MPAIQLKGLNLPAIYVNDLKEALNFYVDILGMEKLRDLGPGVLLKATPDCIIYLESGKIKSPNTKFDKSCVCLCFETNEGVRASYMNLQNAGVEMIGEYHEFDLDFHLFRIADPSGNIIEFAGKP
jgi:catechol 2,3-dioxygenase-like lactoylglutathione lyase family enzyme